MEKREYTHPAAPSIYARNHFSVDGTVVTMQLTQGQVALIEIDDLPLVAEHRWRAYKKGVTYFAITEIPVGDGQRQHTSMQRLIGTTTPGQPLIAHRGHNGLNNQRTNPRAASATERQCNVSALGGSSKFKGVSFHRRDQ